MKSKKKKKKKKKKKAQCSQKKLGLSHLAVCTRGFSSSAAGTSAPPGTCPSAGSPCARTAGPAAPASAAPPAPC